MTNGRKWIDGMGVKGEPKNYCEGKPGKGLKLTGSSDWRLPTAEELDAARKMITSAINRKGFYYWSSTFPSSEWKNHPLDNFMIGVRYDIASSGPLLTTNRYSVRCVRDAN